MVFKKEKTNVIPFESNLNDLLGSLAYKIYLKDFELEIQTHKNNVLAVGNILKYSSLYLFKSLIDLTVVDYPKKNNRFILFYQLLSDAFTTRAKLVTQTDEFVTSLIRLYPNACWAEREAWDMFGIFFNGNYDLRRILTDYGFEDFPLQKTFKLTGTYELNYNDAVKRVIYQHVTEAQKFREFHFSNPWGSFSETDLEEDSYLN
jgi:NADH:ubiquinone oxidoreductase subunit C